LGVADDAVEREFAAVADTQPGAHQDLQQRPAAWIFEPGEVVGVFELGHDRFGQCPQLALVQAWVVIPVEIDVGIQAGRPTVLSGSPQQPSDGADIAGPRLRRRISDRQMREMGFDHLTGHGLRAAVQRREGLREQGDRTDVRAHRPDGDAGREPPADPAFRQGTQPGGFDAVEPQLAVPARVTEAAKQPDVAGYSSSQPTPSTRSCR